MVYVYCIYYNIIKNTMRFCIIDMEWFPQYIKNFSESICLYVYKHLYLHWKKVWRDIPKLLTMIKTREVGFGVILIFLSAVSHLFSTMNMYYLPTLKKQLKEKKKTIGRRGGFFTLREDLFKLFSYRQGPKLSLCLQSPSQCWKGGKKTFPSVKILFVDLFCFKGPLVPSPPSCS